MECRPRDNKLGVTWCIDCGKLFTKKSSKKLTAIKINGIFTKIKP